MRSTKYKIKIFTFLLLLSLGCQHFTQKTAFYPKDKPYLIILGVAQDAGHPQAGCYKQCCQKVWQGDQSGHLVTCLALVDPTNQKQWLFEATPNIREQIQKLYKITGRKNIDGIFLTHAHIGHYTGLMHLGHEAMGAENIPVYAMPIMYNYLKENGPWSQLINHENISLIQINDSSEIALSSDLAIKAFKVPHRDEYSETVGYKISGANQSAIFIPDIDKWEKWDQQIENYITQSDYSFLDGTFFNGSELPGRDLSKIQHPFIQESMERFSSLANEDKTKIYFIHFNHTNPLLNSHSSATQEVNTNKYHISEEMQVFLLD